MPDQLAHYLFARRVWAVSERALRARIIVDSAAFRASCFGPDPLFTDLTPRRRAEGYEMHRRPGREALERMRAGVRAHTPWAAEYAAGFFCHYALDRLCHPYLTALEAGGAARHLPVETAYDRALYLRGVRTLPRRLKLSDSACRAAALIFERVSPAQYRADAQRFWWLRRMLLAGGGTCLADWAGRLNPRWDGVLPPREPSPQVREGIETLDRLLADGVRPAAAQLKRYLAALDGDGPLDPWLNADFFGREKNG